jgi:hypothetical protein
VLEKRYGNLGYWSSTDDRATWTIEVAKPGRYAVWLDWACHPDTAGKKFLVQAGVNQMTGTVRSTGSWDTYRQTKVGEIVLTAGRQQVTFRSARRIFHPLIDLKSMKLVPVKEGKEREAMCCLSLVSSFSSFPFSFPNSVWERRPRNGVSRLPR